MYRTYRKYEFSTKSLCCQHENAIDLKEFTQRAGVYRCIWEKGTFYGFSLLYLKIKSRQPQT
jgi:hypothetical protein